MQQLVQDEGDRFPKAIPSLTKGRYVDDIFGGADTVSETKEIIQQLDLICKVGQFPLQKWNSNYPELLPDAEQKSTSLVEIDPTQLKILGLVWKPTTDTFHFTVGVITTSEPTKRTIASDIAKLFDPLGLISPVLIQAKLLLQQLWLHRVSWDEPISPELCQQWILFQQQLQQLNQLSIPRWLGLLTTSTFTEIHGFSDASQLAMAAVVYIRTFNEHGKVLVRLICSKTRVAPLKRLTIPRLELAAALLLARLMKHIVEALELSNVPSSCWTDSSVAHTWITS